MRRRGRSARAPWRGPAGGRALVGAFRGLGAAAIGVLLWPALTVPFVPAGRAALADAVVHQHRLVVDTLVLALVTALAGTIGGALTAGVHHHFRFRGRGLLHLMLLSPLLLPPVAPAIALLELWGHNGFATRLLGWRSVPVYGFTGLVIAEVMTLLPLAHLMTLVGLSNLDGSLTDQARDMGASEARILARIVLPGMRGALAGVFLLLVAHATVDIANPLALGGSYPVLSTRLREAAAGEGDMTAAGAYGLILLVICALAALAMPGRGHRPFQERLRRRRVPPTGVRDRALVAAAWALAAVEALPLVVCAAASVLAGVDSPRPTGRHYAELLTSGTARLAAADSLLVAAAAVVASTGIALAAVAVAPRAGSASISRVLLASSTPVLPLALGALHWWRAPERGTTPGWAALGLVATIMTIGSAPMMIVLLRQRLAAMTPSAAESAAGLAVRVRHVIRPLVVPHLAPVVPAMLVVALAVAVNAPSPVILFGGADTPFLATRIITDVEAGQLGRASALATTTAALLGLLGGCVTVLVAPPQRPAVPGDGDPT